MAEFPNEIIDHGSWCGEGEKGDATTPWGVNFNDYANVHMFQKLSKEGKWAWCSCANDYDCLQEGHGRYLKCRFSRDCISDKYLYNLLSIAQENICASVIR